jgi:hypothetical protein
MTHFNRRILNITKLYINTSEEDIDYLNYLLAEEDWGMFMNSMPLMLHTKNLYKP